MVRNPESWPRRRRQSLQVFCLFLLAVVLAGCGGSGTPHPPPTPTPTPSGPFSNASVSGPYAFELSGTGASGFFALAGSFQADGTGALTSGALDLNSSAGVSSNVAFSGTYNVLPNGQGTATLNATSIGQTFTLHMVVVSRKRILISLLGSNPVGHGSADLQDPTAFSLAALQGQFAYSIQGIDPAGKPLASVGGFITDGAGALTSGLHDTSDNGVPFANQPLTGTYSVDSGPSGRGTLILNTSVGTLNFAFYIVAADHLKLVESERSPATAGEVFSGLDASASGECSPCVFEWSGVLGSAPYAAAGIYFPPSVDPLHGQQDSNDGTSITNSQLTGSRSFRPHFGGTVTLNSGTTTSNFAFYRAADGLENLLIQIDPGAVVSGTGFLESQAGTPHLDLSFDDGPWAFNFVGSNFLILPEEIGQISTQDPAGNGVGTVAGFLDVTQGGNVTSGAIVNGNFTMDKTARGTLTWQSPGLQQQFVMHTNAGADVLFISTDPNLVVAGVFERQSP